MVSIDRFAVELLRYPGLRSQVRSLKFVRLMSWDFTAYEKPLQQDGPRGRIYCMASREDRVLLAKAAEEELPHLATSTNLCEQIRHFRDEAIAILVITWATNLDSLSLAFGSFNFHIDDDILVSHFAKHVAQQFLSNDGWANRHLPFEKLSHLEFHIRWDRSAPDHEFELGDNLKFLVPFLHLPKLISLKCTAVRTECEYDAWCNNTLEDQLMPYPDRTSSIESVVLIGPHFWTLGPGRFLQALKTLKSLKVRVDGCPQITRGPFNDGSLPRVLIEHASSLEELDLPVYQRSGIEVLDAGPQHMIDFEQHLRPNERLIDTETDQLLECHRKLHVRKLGIPLYFLTWSVLNSRYTATCLTPSHLPDTIEHLTLYSYGDWPGGGPTPPELRQVLVDVLNILTETGDGRLSRLKGIDCTHVLHGCNNEGVLTVKRFAEGRGVKWIAAEDSSDIVETTDRGDDVQDEWLEWWLDQ